MKTIWILCALLSLSSPSFRQRNSADVFLRSNDCKPMLQWGLDNIDDAEARLRINQIDSGISMTKRANSLAKITPAKWPFIDYLPFFRSNNSADYDRFQPWLEEARDLEPNNSGKSTYPDYRLASRLFISRMILEGHWSEEQARREVEAGIAHEKRFAGNNGG